MSADRAPQPTVNERLAQIEESQAFGERTVEQLSAEVAALNRRLADTVARLERLERALEQLRATSDESDATDEGADP